MPASYGHDIHGVNVQNYRHLVEGGSTRRLPGGLRPTHDWQKEATVAIAVTGQEHKHSNTLRLASQLLQEQAEAITREQQNLVEEALYSKMGRIDKMKRLLDKALLENASEITALARYRAGLESRLKRAQQKLSLNVERFKVRCDKPERELVNDNVQHKLGSQKACLEGYLQQLQRAFDLVDRNLDRLEQVRDKLKADLDDKIVAMRLDQRLMSVKPGQYEVEAPVVKKSTCYPHAWAKSTEDVVAENNIVIENSYRLRKALEAAIKEKRTTEKGISQDLNSCLLDKIGKTGELKAALEEQLVGLQQEHHVLLDQKRGLQKSIEDKKAPLNQARQRYALWKTRPHRELVQDEVEHALSKELGQLVGISQQLGDKLSAVDKELGNISSAATVLEANIRDKEAALQLDAKCAMLDGRAGLHDPPPASPASSVVLSSRPMTAHSVARSRMSGSVTSSTLQRLEALEAELEAARNERIALEDTLSTLKGAGQPAAGPA